MIIVLLIHIIIHIIEHKIKLIIKKVKQIAWIRTKNNNINNEEEYYSNKNNKHNSIVNESIKGNYENQNNIKNKTQKIIKIK